MDPRRPDHGAHALIPGTSQAPGAAKPAGTPGGTYRGVAPDDTLAGTSTVAATLTILTPLSPTAAGLVLILAGSLSLPSPAQLPPALFPNAPTAGWRTVADIRWTLPVPFRHDPIYEGDNGTHLVDYSDDDPNSDWGRQTALVTDLELPGGFTSALEMRLPAGLTGGYAATKIGAHPDHRGDGPLLWDPALNTGHLYVGFYVRFSPGFDLNGNVGQKVLYLKSDLPSNSSIAHMVGIMMADGVGGNQLWPTYGPQGPFGRFQVPETTTNNLNDGRWHLVEFLQGPNTPGIADGALKVWVDGRLEGSWTNAMFFAAGHVPSVNRIEINPIFGGGNNPVTRDQWVRMGPMMIRTR